MVVQEGDGGGVVSGDDVHVPSGHCCQELAVVSPLWLGPSPPGSLPPVTVYDRNGFRILLHFSQTAAPGCPEVQVLLLTMMSTAAQPVWDIMFQVAVPKVSTVLASSFAFSIKVIIFEQEVLCWDNVLDLRDGIVPQSTSR